MASTDARDRIGALGADLQTTTPDQLAARIRAENSTWAQIIKESGARVD